jgi:murein L,D-transpeptidase YcbB/YkuD
VKKRSLAGKAVILALFSVAIAGCESKSGVQPSQVEAGALQAAVDDPQVRAFYQARQWRPAWDGKSEKALLDAIGQAPAHGLKPDLFLKRPLAGDANAREAALTAAAIRYASALARGYADPSKIGKIYTIPRPKPNVVQGLTQALQGGDPGAWFASLAPQTDEYRALSKAHLQYLDQANTLHSAPIPQGSPIKPGQRDPRLPAIAAALATAGYLPPAESDAAPPQRYSRAMAAAVRKLQADYAMKPDGTIGVDTVTALNLGPAYKARQLAVALERLRWLERTPPATRIDVNTAASFLEYWRDGALRQQLRVINGQPGRWTTPQIQAPMFQLVANPYWRVPDSIVDDELSKKSASYLAANGFSYRDGRLIQLPGPKNSLGQVKFDMRDKQQIYLHDTPFKSWFATDQRHRSHGCVRVQNALDFADQLASEDGVQDKFQEGLASGDETYVKLKREIPVRLLYHTAWWDGSMVQFRPDIYGWDDDVARALGLEKGPRRAAYKPQEDLGP